MSSFFLVGRVISPQFITQTRFLRRAAVAFFLWPLWASISSFRRVSLKPHAPLRILVIPQMNRIGDLVCATSVFRTIKERYPESFLAIVISKKIAGIVKHNPRIDEIIIHNSPGFIRKIRRRRFHWAVILTNRAEPSVLAFLGAIPFRIKTTIEDRSWSERLTDWLNTHILEYRHHTYLPAHYLQLLEYVGIRGAEDKKEAFVSPAGEEKASEFFSARHLVGERVVGMSITAGNKIKEWGDGKFGELARRLIASKKVKVVFIGAKRDEPRIDLVLATLPPTSAFKAIDFSLEELPSLLKRFNLFVSVDTGPIYIAHALGVPLVNIIGPVDPREQPPQDEKSYLVLPPAHIKPSSFVMKKPGTPDEYRRAVDSIRVEDVMRAVEKLLQI